MERGESNRNILSKELQVSRKIARGAAKIGAGYITEKLERGYSKGSLPQRIIEGIRNIIRSK